MTAIQRRELTATTRRWPDARPTAARTVGSRTTPAARGDQLAYIAVAAAWLFFAAVAGVIAAFGSAAGVDPDTALGALALVLFAATPLIFPPPARKGSRR